VDVTADPPFPLPEHTLLPAEAVEEFDQMAALTRRVLGVPTATVTLVDQNAQIYPGAAGLAPALDAARQTPLPYSYCQFVVTFAEPLVVSDARTHPLLADSPAITENKVIAYAGMPLRDTDNQVIGSLCAIDSEPREWTTEQLETLADLATAVSAQLQRVQLHSRAAVLADRDRIAGTLNERALRELLGLSMRLGSIRSQVSGSAVGAQVDQAMSTLDGALNDIRGTVYGRSVDAAE
jgi:GAF domain-containing protein